MSMADLYQTMKDALVFFGLSFHDMDKVTVTTRKDTGEVVFVYGASTITIKIN